MASGTIAGLFENPFKPDSGRAPPYFAGRQDELYRICCEIADAASGQLVARDLMLYGPGGSGKTALLRVLEQKIGDLELDVTLELMSATRLQSAKDARRELIGVFGQSLWEALEPEQWALDWRGMQAKWQAGELSRSEIRRGLVNNCKSRPLILMIDDAHLMAPGALNELVNEVLTIRGLGGPALVVLAGKPSLAELADLAQVSFLERCEVASLEWLDEQGAKDAVRIPFAQVGVEIEDEALMRLAVHSQGYPQFLQLWGSALWERVSQHGRRWIEVDDVIVVLRAMERQYAEIYRSRLASWKNEDRELLVLLARELMGRAWKDQSQIENLVEALLARQGRDGNDGAALVKRMVESDLLWRPRGRQEMVPALPGFVQYVAQHGL